MLAAGITSGHVLLADWLFLIAAVLFVLLAVALSTGNALATARATSVQLVALALVALGLMVL